jgi:hypothetical protein
MVSAQRVEPERIVEMPPRGLGGFLCLDLVGLVLRLRLVSPAMLPGFVSTALSTEIRPA